MAQNLENQEENSLSDDLFNAAFDETVSGVETHAAPAAETPAAPATETSAAPAAEAPAAPAAETPAVPAAETPAAPAAETPIDVKAVIAEAVAAATKKPDEPATLTGPTAEELAAEEQYKKDWPEQWAREQRLKVQLDEVKTLLATTTEALKGQLAPVLQTAQTTAEEKHIGAIIAAHADAVEIVPKVEAWIATQPKFLQPQYNAVLDKGSAADVIELFTTFKAATGTTNPADPDPKIAEEATRLEAEKTDRLNRMRGVTTIRTSISAEDDPDDFDSAFDAEAKKLKIAA